ncbi:hypothetical protein [Lysinibacillus sphaericus]|nr:hypothetical protein [Lysinibacillus sphaericus]
MTIHYSVTALELIQLDVASKQTTKPNNLFYQASSYDNLDAY